MHLRPWQGKQQPRMHESLSRYGDRGQQRFWIGGNTLTLSFGIQLSAKTKYPCTGSEEGARGKKGARLSDPKERGRKEERAQNCRKGGNFQRGGREELAVVFPLFGYKRELADLSEWNCTATEEREGEEKVPFPSEEEKEEEEMYTE